MSSITKLCQFKPMTIIQRLKQTCFDTGGLHLCRPRPPGKPTWSIVNIRNAGSTLHCHTNIGLITPKRSFHDSKSSKQNYRKGRGARLITENEHSVEKDIVLYRYDNARFIKFMNVFAISQFMFWIYLSHFAFTMMKDVPVSEEDKNDPKLPWWRKMNFGKFRSGITVGCFSVGWGTMAIAWMYTLRSVRFLVLKKGGVDVTFITFSPFNRYKSLTVPLNQVSAKQSRMSSTAYLPLKVKGKFMHFILDMKGEFLNTKLFDYSAGLQRNWKK